MSTEKDEAFSIWILALYLVFMMSVGAGGQKEKGGLSLFHYNNLTAQITGIALAILASTGYFY